MFNRVLIVSACCLFTNVAIAQQEMKVAPEGAK